MRIDLLSPQGQLLSSQMLTCSSCRIPIAMRLRHFAPTIVSIWAVLAKDTTILSGTATTGTLSGVSTTGSLTGDNAIPTGVTYLSISTTITLSQSSVIQTGNASIGTANSTSSGTESTTSSNSLTLIGGTATVQSNETASSTASAPRRTNTQACNGYSEFCSRSYSNITMVTAHNSNFIRKNNAASNQDLSVADQLNDGIRMCK
jgi:hypothetical protein